MEKIYSVSRKFLYSVTIFMFFPLAWANHFRILPGHEIFHYAGFVLFIVLSIWMLLRLGEDKKIDDDFAETVDMIYLLVLICNVIVYIVAWVWRGGPGFAFIDGNGCAKAALLLLYIVWLIFFLFASDD